MWAPPTLWSTLVETIAVDSSDRVYVSDGDAVFRIVDGTPTTVLKPTDLPPPTPPYYRSSSITSVAVDEHDVLYILRLDEVGNAEILSWDGVSTVKLFRSLPMMGQPRHLNAIGSGTFAFITDEGLFETTATKLTRDYDATAIALSPGCLLEYLSMTPSRFVFFSPGCNGSSLLGGRADGSGMRVMASTADFDVYANFEAFGRDPAGGAVALVEKKGLYEIDATRRVLALPTTPDILTVATGELGFIYSRLAVGTKWRVFILADRTVYKAEPLW